MNKSKILITLKRLEEKSDCEKRSVGACILDSLGYLVSTGYNHKVVNRLNEFECIQCSKDCKSNICPAVHAEIDCLNKVSFRELYARKATTMCVSYSPCPECCKAILAAGIERIYVKEPRTKQVPGTNMTYDELSEKLLSGIRYIRIWELLEDTEEV